MSRSHRYYLKRCRSNAQKAQLAAVRMNMHSQRTGSASYGAHSTKESIEPTKKHARTPYEAHICHNLQKTMRRERWAKSTIKILRSKLHSLASTLQNKCHMLQFKLNHALSKLEATETLLSKAEGLGRLLTEKLLASDSKVLALSCSIASLQKQNLESDQKATQASRSTQDCQKVIQRLRDRNRTLQRSQSALRKRIIRAPMQKARAAASLAKTKSCISENRTLKDSRGVILPEIRDLLVVSLGSTPSLITILYNLSELCMRSFSVT